MKHKVELEYETEEFLGIMGMLTHFMDKTANIVTLAITEKHESQNKRERKNLKEKIENVKSAEKDPEEDTQTSREDHEDLSRTLDTISRTLQRLDDRITAIEDHQINKIV